MARNTRKCIKDFVKHVDALEAEEDPDGNGFNREYRLIHEVQIKNRRENVFQMTAGKAENNLKKNRYKDILPYDGHRVLLSEVDGEENSDYVNASRLMGVKGTGGYIATQGPLAATVNDFWRMVWECEIEIVFMACKIVELGKIKCKQYWNDVGKSDLFGDINVFTESEEVISPDFIQRKFLVTRNGEERQITQFHYLGWPDHGIPDDPAHIKDLISITRETRKNDQAPLLVHCSAGCGRTGAIVAIDFVWTLLEQGRFDETFSLYDLICNFREQRMSMVQTSDQYALVNKVLKSLCEEWLDKMASHTYVNVELKEAQKTVSDEDDVYMNAVSVNSKLAPKLSPQTVKDNVSGSGTDTGPGPVLIDLPPPSYAAPKPPGPSPPSQSYQNVVIMPDSSVVVKDPLKSPQLSPSTAVGDSGPKQTQPTTLHKTVIQLGDTPPPKSSSDKTVINLVRGGSLRSSSSSSTSSSSGADGGATSTGAPILRSKTVTGVASSLPSDVGLAPPLAPKQTAKGSGEYCVPWDSSYNLLAVTTPPTSPTTVKAKPQLSPKGSDATVATSATNTSTGKAKPQLSPKGSNVTVATPATNPAPAQSPPDKKGSGKKKGSSLRHIVKNDDVYTLADVPGRQGVDASQRGGSLKSKVAPRSPDIADANSLVTQPLVLNGDTSSGTLIKGQAGSLKQPTHKTTLNTAMGPSSFGDYLPRVQGPVPAPQAWIRKL